MSCWNCEGLLHPARMCPSPVGCAKTGERCPICKGFGHGPKDCTSPGGGKHIPPSKGAGNGGAGKGGNKGNWNKGGGGKWGNSGNFNMGKGGKGMSAFDAWPGAPIQASEPWAMNGNGSTGMPTPWLAAPPGIYNNGGWGNAQGNPGASGAWDGWHTQGGVGGTNSVNSVGKPRQMSMLTMKRATPTQGIPISNKFTPLSDEIDMANKVGNLKPTTFFDNIYFEG